MADHHYYLLKDAVEPCTAEQLPSGQYPYVAVLSPEAWQRERDSFNMGIDFEPTARELHNTKAEVNYDSLTGTFRIPDRDDLTERDYRFAFALDEKGVVFIDGSGRAVEMIETIRRTKRYRKSSLERFLYDFLEQIIGNDMHLMEQREKELDDYEDRILAEEEHVDLARINEIRGDVRELRIHYEQLIDLMQELEENENGFFAEDNLRYFRLFMNRMSRLHDTAASLAEHAMQVRDLYQAQLSARQNRTVTLLTVVTTVFMPLTLIVGWYGMNFRYMPELDKPWGYPAVIVVSVAIEVVSLWFFKKKKWL